MKVIKLLLIYVGLLFCSSSLFAGAGANIYACIYLSVKPISPITFNFTPNDDQCMLKSGNATSLTVKDAGITCTSIGYVESKASNTCWFKASYWTLAYNAGVYSSSVKTLWIDNISENEILFTSSDGHTHINTMPARGTDTDVTYHGTGTFYIIFDPVSPALIKALTTLKHFIPKDKHSNIDELIIPLISEHNILKGKQKSHIQNKQNKSQIKK